MGDRIALPWFDGAEADLEEPETPQKAAALKAFLSLTAQDRLAASRHVYAYYRDYHAIVGGEDWLDAQMGVPAQPEDIWQHVTPQIIAVDSRPDMPGHVYVVIEADCAWEEEHGLMLVWEDGTELIKVSGYDGHTTNVFAYDDDSLADVVYAASDPQFTTRRDP
ncbi:MAG: hypothetical protein AAF744_03015 [Pseudomonadota bacterium]